MRRTTGMACCSAWWKASSKAMKWKVGFIVVLAVGVASCDRGSRSPGSSPTVAKVGGQPIAQALFDAYVTEKSGVPPDQVSATLKASLLTDLEKMKAPSEPAQT